MTYALKQTLPVYDLQAEHLKALQRAIDDIEYYPVGGRGEVQRALDYFRAHSFHQRGVTLFFLGLRERKKEILKDAFALIPKYLNERNSI